MEGTLQLKGIQGTFAFAKNADWDSQKPTLLFLHDSLGCIKLWRDFPALLAQQTGCNYFIYDRLGYGQSSRDSKLPDRGNDYHTQEAEILLQLIDEVGIQKPILFGHSDGGTIALIAGTRHPRTLLGIITEGAHIFVEDITLKGIREAQKAYATTNLREKLYKYHGERVDDIFNAWTGVWLAESFRDWNIEDILHRITCPTLIIQGEKDEYGTLEQVETIFDQVSGGGQSLIIPEVGHSPHKENPTETLANCQMLITRINRYV